MKSKRINCSAIFVVAASASVLCGVANASLIGGTYTSSAGGNTWPGSPVYKSIANGAGGLGAVNTGQAYTAQDSHVDGTILSEVVTPASTLTLGAIAIEVSGMSSFASGGMSLHVFPLTSSGGSTFFNGSNAFYTVGTDLLGGGSGLPFSANGIPSNSFLTFALNNTTTSDNITLTGGTSYAVEFWDQSNVVPGTYTATEMTWLRLPSTTPVDPNGGQMFANKDTLSSASRNTLAANGLAGGSPRTATIALYSVPEPTTVSILTLASAGLMFRRRRQEKASA